MHLRARRLAFVLFLIAAIMTVAWMDRTMIEGFLERNFVFFPSKPLMYSPEQLGMDFDDVYFSASDGVRLNAWLITASDDAPVVLWFHGNAGNIADRLENARLLVDRGLSLFMVDYRGYGKSEGAPSEKGIYADGQGAYNCLMSRGVKQENLIVFGRSLGSSVAVYVASNNDCAGVILESAFTNMADMARVHFPIIPGMGSFKHKFNSTDRIGSISAPILFTHGDKDELVPYDLGRRLFEAAGPENEFYTIRGAHHNDTYFVGGTEYFDRVESFVREKTGREDSSTK